MPLYKITVHVHSQFMCIFLISSKMTQKSWQGVTEEPKIWNNFLRRTMKLL